MDVLIDGFAHEGALKNPDRFGQSNYKAACGVIHWWLKRRWSRLAVITAVASRHDALRYVGGSAQRQAATQRAQDRDNWRVDGAFREPATEVRSAGQDQQKQRAARNLRLDLENSREGHLP